ncbi:MAG: MATE family efflux transporter [Clostridiales bacterium]|nr:MATE family efflux transporter [Clostridiales bacterium]
MKTRDMTSGSPLRLILLFSLPMMAGNICQQLYHMVDAAFLGRGDSPLALAALGAGDWFNWVILGIIWGYTQGFSVLISQFFGAGDMQNVRRTVGLSISLTLVISLLLTFVSQLLVNPVLTILETPENIFDQAALYLRILFGALPILGAYNVQAAILRAVGDSKSPLYAMLIASGTNIALDALFVMGFHWGVAGAAAATVIAQTVSAIYCFIVIRRIPVLRFHKDDLKWRREIGGKLLKLGTPLAAQNAVIGVGGMVLQRIINPYQSDFIAGYTATNKLYGLMEMAAVSFGGALGAYTGQNFGARKMDRVKKGVRVGIALSLGTSLLIAGALLIFGRSILSLFVDPAYAQSDYVLDVAQRYLNIMLYALPVLYLLYVYRSSLQGMGDTLTPMVSGMVELAMRVGVALFLPAIIGPDGIFIAEIAAWIGAAVLLVITYYLRMSKFSTRKVL